MSGQEEDIRGPLGVSPSDESPKGCCEVICVFPELKVKKKFSGGKLKDIPDSGVFDCKFSQRSIDLTLECKTKQKKVIKYSYKVKKLPGEIVPDESKVKYKDGKVILLLKKVDSRSWQREIAANGLDQHVEEEEEPGKDE